MGAKGPLGPFTRQESRQTGGPRPRAALKQTRLPHAGLRPGLLSFVLVADLL